MNTNPVFFYSSFIHSFYKLAVIVNGENFEPTVSLSLLLYYQPVIPCIFTSNRKFQDKSRYENTKKISRYGSVHLLEFLF